VQDFLARVWQRFGIHPVERLNAFIVGQEAYRKAAVRGMGEEIPFEALAEGFKTPEQKKAPTIRTDDGRRVTKWVPSRSAPKGRR
jgi:hypothetical protein